jgi:signal transduction histidine kinase
MREAQATDNEQDVRKQLEEWEYKGRLLETLVTLLTYEVRTPLSAILGYSEILLQDAVGEVNDKQKECFTAIGNSTESTITALEQFFDAHYALISGRLYLKFEQVDIEELLRAIKPDNLNLEIPKEIPKIWGDSRRLARAFEVFFQRQC